MKRLNLLLASILLVGFGVKQANAQFSENFDGPFPPAGWAIFDNGVGTGISWVQDGFSYAGAGAAYMNYDCSVPSSSQDWLVTPLIPITSGNSTMVFYQQDPDAFAYGTVYTIRVSIASQTNPADFTIIDTQVEPDVPSTYAPYVVDLSAYVGSSVYIAFVQEQDCGDSWYIDELTIGGAPCLDASNLDATNITNNSADFNWNTNGATSWEVGYTLNGNTLTSSTLVATNSYAATGLSANTAYDYYVQAQCPNANASLMISGVMDGPLTGGTPKFVELYATGDIPDLSRYGLSSANNGAGTTAPNPEFVFPAVSVTAGTYIYIASEAAFFNTYMGFAADYVNGATNVNGDDAIELFKDNVVIDVFGDVNVDGTGTPWEYLDGWVYRNANTAANPVFTVSDWTYSGINANDGCTLNGTCGSVFPNGTFTTTELPMNWVGPFTFTTLCNSTVGNNQADAIEVTGVSYTTINSTDSCYTNSGLTFYSSPDVWYQVVIDNCATSLDVNLCGAATDFDTYLTIFANDGITELLSNDDDCGVGSAIVETIDGTNISAGDTIYVVVNGYATSTGTYELEINQTVVTPDASFTVPMADYCEGTTVVTPTITGDAGGTFSCTTMTVDGTTGEFTTNTVGAHQIIYTVGSGSCFGVDSVLVNVNTYDDATFSYDSAYYCINSTMGSLPTISGTTGGTFTSTTGVVFVNANTGEIDLSSTPIDSAHTVVYTTAGPCPDSSAVTIMVVDCGVTSVEEISNLDAYAIYPNPNNGQFVLQNKSTAGEVHVVVTNVLGSIVFDKTTNLGQNEQYSIEFDQAMTGTYFVTVSNAEVKTTFKMIVK